MSGLSQAAARFPLRSPGGERKQDASIAFFAKKAQKEAHMISQRNTHYFLWFLLFGVVYGLAKGYNSEAFVVTVSGLLGLVTGTLRNANLTRIYDLVVGLLFAALGLLGILTSFPSVSQHIGVSTAGVVLGLYLGIPYALIHTVLGLTSLSHSFRPTAVPTTTTIATPTAA
jgi:hypothetical protein